MSSINFNIDSWLALSPGLLTRDEWHHWSNNHQQWPVEPMPVVASLIKPMMRRRMSSLSKLALQTALQIAIDQPVDYIVFSSRHGELTRTVKLIEEIMAGDDASPMAFSQSVHNTAAGLFTISTHRATPVTSLAAVESTLHHALIEASIYLQENPTHHVLLVDFDEPLPTPYQQYEKQNYQSVAFAALLSAGKQYQLSWEKSNAPVEEQLPQSFAVIDYLLNDEKQINITDNRLQWSWTCQ
ncbi:beta-ketoacyl synthase chain length factor [Psychromonas hadalis]|uniref:beta-ketoacyl synthase chain length factor n=1 Tax=Psychromonas hadalis TaxID=211669 RepID=UPI0003B49E51|nr:beta-ketoacyl synthase chain length factor [Psychromonas hadalis]